jgi:multiple sugar transport system permease protein
MQLSQKPNKMKMIKKNFGDMVYALPFLMIFFIFFIFPFLYGIVISFFDWNFFQPEKTSFVGFDNFLTIWFNDESIFYDYFWSGLFNTLTFVVLIVPIVIVVPLFFAILIDFEPKGYKIFRTILFLPTILSISSVILIWQWQFFNNGGFINALLTQMGFEEIPFLLQQPWAWIAIIIVTIWWTMGTNMVILGAGLKNIDKTLYEAAAIDGASYFQTLRYVILPSLAPQMIIVLITTVLASFNIYGQPDLLTNGGPDFTTTVLMMRIRPLAFGPNARPGIATAMAVSMGILMIIISFIQLKIVQKQGATE